MDDTNGKGGRGRGNFGPRARGETYRRVLELAAKGDGQADIARRLGVSRQRVHQILKEAGAKGGPRHDGAGMAGGRPTGGPPSGKGYPRYRFTAPGVS